MLAPSDLNEITRIIVLKAIEVHRALGPGLLESTYLRCLVYELILAGLQVEVQKPLPIRYKDVYLECGYRLDILVEGKVVIEVPGRSDIELQRQNDDFGDQAGHERISGVETQIIPVIPVFSVVSSSVIPVVPVVTSPVFPVCPVVERS